MSFSLSKCLGVQLCLQRLAEGFVLRILRGSWLCVCINTDIEIDIHIDICIYIHIYIYMSLNVYTIVSNAAWLISVTWLMHVCRHAFYLSGGTLIHECDMPQETNSKNKSNPASLGCPLSVLEVFSHCLHPLWEGYGVATMSRMLKNTGLFAEYRSLL